MKVQKRGLLFFIVFTYSLTHLLTYSLTAAVKVIPVVDLQLLSGQYFYDGSANNLAGNMFFNVTPAIKLNEKFSIIPGLTTQYKATKQIEDLAGGGTLFQDVLDGNLSSRFIYKLFDNLKLKLDTSYKLEYRRETKDESIADGLFDYKKVSYGFETEYAISKQYSARIGADRFTIKFPNYESLESGTTAAAAGLSRELAGSNVLDTKNISGSAGATAKLPFDITLDADCIYIKKDFDDQPIVLLTGSLSSEQREDKVYIGNLGLIAPVLKKDKLKIIAVCNGMYTVTNSDQNHYDARKTTFIENYYDYTSKYYNPAVTFLFGTKPYAVTASYGLEDKKYKDRPVQDENGTYDLERKIWSETQNTTVSFIYPVSKGFKLKASTTYLWERSNMGYEELYKYKYNTANYLMGFSYEY
ncbi:MAG: hypothetical protein JW983_02865 [Elusimicrobia bacterium]|nr:hypothetical protein [Elusimicrobiota bacterium]